MVSSPQVSSHQLSSTQLNSGHLNSAHVEVAHQVSTNDNVEDEIKGRRKRSYINVSRRREDEMHDEATGLLRLIPLGLEDQGLAGLLLLLNLSIGGGVDQFHLVTEAS